jgi:hypothetical protein
VVTDGYHCSQPLEVVYHHIHVYYFRISCAVDNNKLAAGGIITALLFLAGFTSNTAFIIILSFIPIIAFIYFYYIKKEKFIQIKPAS